MERLEAIKKALPLLKLHGELKEDIDWLIKQAEKLERLEKESVVQAFLNNLNNFDRERIENADNLTIGELLFKLESFKDDEKVIFSNGKFFDGTYDSYRGYYQDLYIGFDDEDKGFNSVGKIREVLKDALKCGFMIGYKGGEYKITEHTLVWFATYGTTYGSEMVVEVENFKDYVLIFTKDED